MLEKPFVKPLKFEQWLCRKPSAGLIWAALFGVQYTAAAVACTERQTDMSHIYSDTWTKIGIQYNTRSNTVGQ